MGLLGTIGGIAGGIFGGGPIGAAIGTGLGGLGDSLLGGGGSSSQGSPQLPGVKPIDPAILALAGAQGVNAANLSKKSTDYATNAADQANSQYAAKAPLRAQGIAGILNPQHPDLSGLDATRMSGNPFAHAINLPAVSSVSQVALPASGPSSGPAAPPPGPSGPIALPPLAPIPSGKSGQQIMPSDLVALMKLGPQSGLTPGAQTSAIQAYQQLNPDYTDGTTS